jgi:hypothetical protein
MVTRTIEHYCSKILTLFFSGLTIVLLSSQLCAARGVPSGEGLTSDQRQKVKDFITQARQDAREIFSDPARRDIERQRLLNKIDELTALASRNTEDRKLINNAREWIEKSYTAMGKMTTQGLESRIDKIRSKIEELEQKAQSIEEKNIIKAALDAANKSYLDFKNRTAGKTTGTKELTEKKPSPAVTALIETNTREEAPLMETPSFEAPPLESTTNVPSLVGSEPTKERSTPLKLSRGDFLAEIRKGRQLRSSSSKQNTSEPSQQPSIMDDIRKQMAQRRQAIAPTE